MSETTCTECGARPGVRVDGDDLCACVECRARLSERRDDKDTDPAQPTAKRRFESRLREG